MSAIKGKTLKIYQRGNQNCNIKRYLVKRKERINHGQILERKVQLTDRKLAQKQQAREQLIVKYIREDKRAVVEYRPMIDCGR